MRNPAVLVLTWNRAENLQQVLERVVRLSPRAVYISGDGAQPGHPQEAAVKKCRAVVDNFRTGIRLYTSFSPIHRGLRESVLGGIDWFLTEEGEGIILEDDILIDRSFFRFAQIGLEQFRRTRSVAQISGTNHAIGATKSQGSFYFSRFQHIWGFATWKRSWNGFREFCNQTDVSIEMLRDAFPNMHEGFYWHWLRRVKAELVGRSDTWTATWNFYCASLQRLSVTPDQSLVENIGFDASATNSKRIPLIAGGPPRKYSQASIDSDYRALKPTEDLDRYVALTQWPTAPLLLRVVLGTIEFFRRVSQRHRTEQSLSQRAVSVANEPLTVAQEFFLQVIFGRKRPRPGLHRIKRFPSESPAASRDFSETPVLVLAWKRPLATENLLAELKRLGVRKVYVHVDGAGEERPHIARLCAETKAVIKNFREDFDLQVRFSDTHLGLQESVLRGVDWLFETEAFGLILEDDVVPTEALLEFVSYGSSKYEHDDSISQLSATNHLMGAPTMNGSVMCSRFHHIWGFATWERSWRGFSTFKRSFNGISEAELRRQLPGYWDHFYRHWSRRLKVRPGREVEWDSAWNMFNFLRGSYSLSPAWSLATNVGFDRAATHFKRVPLIAGLPTKALDRSVVENFSKVPASEAELFDRFTAMTAWNTLPYVIGAPLAMLELLSRALVWRKPFRPARLRNRPTVAQRVCSKAIFRRKILSD